MSYGPLLKVAGRALADSWGEPVTLRVHDPIRTAWGRHLLLRCRVVGGGRDRPGHVILKQATTKDGHVVDEWAGLELVNSIESIVGLVPRLHAGDADARLLVLEDLGDGPSVHRLLQSTPGWATAALVESQSLLGRIHAGTRGCASRFDALRAALPPVAPHPRRLATSTKETAALVAGAERATGGAMRPALDDVLKHIDRLERASALHCLTLRDLCPPNRILADGTLRAVDLELCAVRHPMLDGAYGQLAHLHCNDGLPLPPALRERLTRAYRLALCAGYPEYEDDRRFADDLAAGCAVWLLHALRAIPRAMERSREVGFHGITDRRRVVTVLEMGASAVESSTVLAPLAAWATSLRARLGDLWPDATILRGYSVFR